jgi:hypothetical protein
MKKKLEVFVYSKDAIGQWFKPYFYRKFVLEAELEVKEGLVRVYRLGNECYLGIVFVDGKVRDGLTVVRERRRRDHFPVAYVDEVGNFTVAEWEKEKLLGKVARLKRYVKDFEDWGMMPVKTENIDPLDSLSYWASVDISYREPSHQEELNPFLVLKTGKGEIQISLLKRLGRDNIDLYINLFPNEERFLIKGKAGETYLARRGWIKIMADLKGAFHYLGKFSEDYPIEEVIVLDEKTYARTGLSPILSEIA